MKCEEHVKVGVRIKADLAVTILPFERNLETREVALLCRDLTNDDILAR